MAQKSPTRLYQGTPGTTIGTAFTEPADDLVDVDCILVSNTTGSSATISVELVPSGGAAATSKMIFDAVSVGANVSVNLLPSGAHIPLQPGDTLQVLQATASALNVVIAGQTVTD